MRAARLSSGWPRAGPVLDKAEGPAQPPEGLGRLDCLLFAANLVLHSGVDDVGGHFVGAYGVEEIDHTVSADCAPPNARRTRSRSSLCAAG